MTAVQNINTLKKPFNQQIKRYILITIGVVIAALFCARFLGVNSIATGGLFGAGVVIQQIIPGLDPGLFALLGNLPLLLIAWFVLGKEFVFNTVYGTILFDILVWTFNKYIPYHPTDLMLSGIIGGAGYGIGEALILMHNSTTGGTDIISRLFQKLFPHVKIGAMLLIVDAVVIIALMLVKHNMDIGYIAIIAHVVTSYVIDTIIEGLDLAKVVYILSDKYEEVSKALMESMGRGITAMRVTGMYHAQDRMMLMCVIKVNEVSALKKVVHSIDESAFVIFSEAHEVLGTEKFKKLSPQNSA